MSEETERLAREAEARRSNVDQTLDQLKEKFSLGQIVDELSGYVREGQGADMVKNLNRQVRDNPLALGLVGAGLAWLLAGPGVRDRGDRYDDRRDGYRPFDRDRLSGGGYPIADGRPHVVGEGPYGSASAHASGGRDTGHDGPGLMDRAKGAASGVGSAASSAGSSISDAAHSASDRVGHAVHDARDAVHDAGERVYESTAYAARRVGDYGTRARRSFLDTLQEEPLIVGAVALAIGAAVGAALPPTRREDELFGQTRDRLRDDAFDYGRDTLHKAEHVAGEAYRAANEEAENKGLKPSGEGETLAQKASSVLGRAGEAAKDDARKEGLI